ncbi:MAG: hypothetical protein ACE1ZE_07385 [Candidatus Binatia bacterium]
MVRVPHHDPEHGGSIFLTTVSLSMGRRVRVAVRQAHRPEEDRGEDSRAAHEKLTRVGVLSSTLERLRSKRERFPHRSSTTILTARLGQAGGSWAFFNGLVKRDNTEQ